MTVEALPYPPVLAAVDRLRTALWAASKIGTAGDTELERQLAADLRAFAKETLGVLDEITEQPRHVLLGSHNRPRTGYVTRTMTIEPFL